MRLRKEGAGPEKLMRRIALPSEWSASFGPGRRVRNCRRPAWRVAAAWPVLLWAAAWCVQGSFPAGENCRSLRFRAQVFSDMNLYRECSGEQLRVTEEGSAELSAGCREAGRTELRPGMGSGDFSERLEAADCVCLPPPVRGAGSWAVSGNVGYVPGLAPASCRRATAERTAQGRKS